MVLFFIIGLAQKLKLKVYANAPRILVKNEITKNAIRIKATML